MCQFRKNRSRFSNTDNIITIWLQSRQAMLVAYNEICQAQRRHNTQTLANPEKLEYFCQLLMDYVAMGQFKVFEKLAEIHASSALSNKSNADIDLDKNLLEKILNTTHVAVDFNDYYESEKAKAALASASDNDDFNPTQNSNPKSNLNAKLNSKSNIEKTNIEKSKAYANFFEEFSKLGAHLAHRMDWEDKLIQQYIEITKYPPKASAASF